MVKQNTTSSRPSTHGLPLEMKAIILAAGYSRLEADIASAPPGTLPFDDIHLNLLKPTARSSWLAPYVGVPRALLPGSHGPLISSIYTSLSNARHVFDEVGTLHS